MTEPEPARERIIAAAIEVFGALGFSKSTVHEIAAAAQLSKPIFYRHFENKSDVFGVVVDRVCSQWYDALREQTLAYEGRTADSLRAIFLGTLEHTRARPLLQRLLTRDSQLLIWSETDVFDRTHARVRELIASILAEGLASGDVRADVPIEHLADAVNELVSVYAVRQLIPGTPFDPALDEGVASFIASGVAARP